MLFGKKKPDGRTLLLLDVEQGSVGTSLVRLNPGEAPKLFGETRVVLRALPTRDSASLLHHALGGIREALAHAAQTAARVRAHPKTGPLGEVSRAAVFLAAPWGAPSLSAGTPHFTESMRAHVDYLLEESFGGVPTSVYTGAGSVAAATTRILPQDPYLLVLVGGEISEMVLLAAGAAAGYATAPLGRHTLVRTLRAHGAGDHELSSLLHLPAQTKQEVPGPFAEPLRYATLHWGSELAAAAAPLVARHPPQRVWVLAHGVGEREAAWFARALTESADFAALFPQGGQLRALRSPHVMRYIAAHAAEPDLTLSLQALYSHGLF